VLYSGYNQHPLYSNRLGHPPAHGGWHKYLVENMNGHTAYCWQNVGLLQSNTIYTLSRCRPMT